MNSFPAVSAISAVKFFFRWVFNRAFRIQILIADGNTITPAMRFQSTPLDGIDGIVALCLLACLTSFQAVASDRYLSTFDQIPSPNFGRVNSILRDDRGFLWFGTDRGLWKFDGYQVRVFAIGFTSADKRLIITSMIRMDSGSLLLATEGGLWAFDLRTEQSSPFLPGTEISDSRINTIIEAPGGTIWIGTSEHGLFSYNRTTKAVQRYTTTSGLSSNHILSLLPDRTGRLWIGTWGGGLNALDSSTSRIVHYRSSANDPATLYSNRITALCENDNQELWIGTSEGLNILHLKTGRMRRIDLHSRIEHTVSSITRDHSGRMWIAVSDLGLVFYSNGVFTTFTTLDDVGRSLNLIRTLYLDPVASTGNHLLLWVGYRNGVNKILMSINPFTNHIRNQDSLYLDRGAVLSLCEDRNGILWAGMWGGGLDMLRRANGSYRRVASFKNSSTDPSSLPYNNVGSLMEDRHGNLWIGTRSGLATLDAARKRMRVHRSIKADPGSLANDHVGAIYEDRSGTIWICTSGGLSEIVPGKAGRFKNYLKGPKEADSVQGNLVSDIFEDRRSNLWVATYGRGLNKREAKGTFKRFLHPGDSSRTKENWIYCFVEDNEGMFWLSTMAGLVSFDPQAAQFTRHPIEQLHDAHIFGIHVDKRNDLWLSTGIGLAKFSPKTGTFTRFDEKHGVSFVELRSGFYKNTSGRLFVGGLDGFIEFDPDSISTVSHPPEIALTALSVFDQEISASALAGGEIHFPYDQNFISISFAALDYVEPLRNRFTYKMVGVDNDWVEAGTRNYARYPNLNPGNYVFQVRGSNSDDVWNETGTFVTIVVAPPYWQTWWFRILAAAFIASTIYAVYRYRIRKLLEVERLRMRIADDLHDDVGSNLSTIAMVARAIQRAPELTRATKRRLAEIYETAVTTSDGMKEIVWFIKPENDTLDDLLLRMKDTASSLLANVDHDFHSPKDRSSSRVTVEFKRNFFLAFKEILTNIVKHASAPKVEIRVEQKNGMLEMVIRDNGRGFDESTVRRGNGLGSLRSRAQNIGGVCEITTGQGKGTAVRFSGRL